MVFFNYTTMELAAKIVYYGPGLCGKTTNLQYIYRKTAPKTRGEMVCLATETDRTLFFDLLPIKLGNIGGFNTRFQLYTVPGQVFYNSTRKLVLKGVDAVVFVADSQEPMLDANIESFENLEENLKEHNLEVTSIPLVLQYNKRDLPNTLPLAELDRYLNKHGFPRFEAVATVGKGVLTTLKEISKLTLKYIRRKVGQPFTEEPEAVAVVSPAGVRSPAASPRSERSEEEEVEFDISGGTEISEAGRLVVPTLEPRAAGAERVESKSGIVAPPTAAPIRIVQPEPAAASESRNLRSAPSSQSPRAAVESAPAESKPARPIAGPIIEPARPLPPLEPAAAEARGVRPAPGAAAQAPRSAPAPLTVELPPVELKPLRPIIEPARPLVPAEPSTAEPRSARPAASAAPAPERPASGPAAEAVAPDGRPIRPLIDVIAEAPRARGAEASGAPPAVLASSTAVVDLAASVQLPAEDLRVLEKEVVQKVRVPIRMAEVNGHQKIRLRLRLEVECVVVDSSGDGA
jgi:mutual gliding-motility protein MglA